MNDKTFNNKILIIGTGPGALSCAYKLYENGYRPIIIESGQLPGGFMRNVCFENYKVDLNLTNFQSMQISSGSFVRVQRLSRKRV